MAQAEYGEEAKLIRLVENFPAIYDVNHIDNKNPIAISSMWEIISKKIKLPTEECYAKWKYLRRRFTSCSGPSTSWPHYEAMKFLEQYITRRKKKHNTDEEETNTVADLPPPSKKRKRETNETEESIKLFCQSISGDLLQLSAEKQMEVRIKIMILIQKYLSNSDQSNESGDTLVAKIMEAFSQIEKKIVRQKMPESDPDWLFVYCIKNVFSNMMSLRQHNKELQNVLHEFEVVEKFYEDENFDDVNPLTVNKKEPLPRETKAAFKKTAMEESKDNEKSDVILIEDEPIIKEEIVEKTGKIIKEERKVNTCSISPPHTIETMKNQILSNGIDRNKFCHICNIKIEDNSHINTDAHITASKRYHLPYGIYILNPALFEFTNNMPRCIACEKTFNSSWDLAYHMFKNKEKHHEHCTAIHHIPNPERELFRFIKKGVFTVGNSFSFCFLCNKHGGDKSHLEKDHLQNVVYMRAFCRRLNVAYCFCCKKSFDIVKLASHIDKKYHQRNFVEYNRSELAKRRKDQF